MAYMYVCAICTINYMSTKSSKMSSHSYGMLAERGGMTKYRFFAWTYIKSKTLEMAFSRGSQNLLNWMNNHFSLNCGRLAKDFGTFLTQVFRHHEVIRKFLILQIQVGPDFYICITHATFWLLSTTLSGE